MQKIHKVIITLILAALIINVLPFKLFAVSETYYIGSLNNKITVYTYDNGSSNYNRNVWANSDDVRFTLIKTNSTTFQLYAVCLSNAYKAYSERTDNQSVTEKNVSTSGVYNYNQFYYSMVTSTYTDSAYSNYLNFTEYDNSRFTSGAYQQAYYYTFGEGAVDPVVPSNFGLLKIGFKTDIAYSGGNQDAWRLNRDTIYFDRYDTLGNDLFGYNIELQAVPFSVYDSSQSNVISKTVNDYLYDTVHVGSLGYWSPGQDYIDFTWEYITTRFSPVWWSTYGDNWSFTGWALENQWYRVGWSYRARLVDDEYNELIPWQWIYNGTSIDGPDVNNIVNNNGLTPDLVNSINNINNYNNTTNNNTYNNQTINYYSSDQQSDGSWIEALLESILGTISDLVGKILDFFKSILDDLLDLILGLFGDVDPVGSFFNWFSDLFNGIGDIDLTLPQFNLPNVDLSSFNRLVQETLNIFSSNNIAFLIFIPLIILIIRAVF